jgi:(p)ppGpp synthase/HD superfamily hydrolase
VQNSKKGIVEWAHFFARSIYHGQTIGESKAPFITHPEEVASLVQEFGGSDVDVASALLHDAVNKTRITLDEIGEMFGSEVKAFVYLFTDPVYYSDLKSAEIMKHRAVRFVHSPRSVKMIGVCEQISNLRLLINDPPEVWTPKKTNSIVVNASSVANNCKEVFKPLQDLFWQTHGDAVGAVNIRSNIAFITSE